MTIDDIERVLHDIYCEAFMATGHQYAKLESLAHLARKMIATAAAPTATLIDELAAHPMADELVARLKVEIGSREAMEQAAHAMMAEARDLTATLREAR